MYEELVRRFWAGDPAPARPVLNEYSIYHCDACDVRGRGLSCWMCGGTERLRVVAGAIDTRASGNSQAHGPLPTRH